MIRSMKTVCSFCGAIIREGSGGDDAVSHGICPSCFSAFRTRYGFNIRKFLDLFDAPLFLVDDDARVMAANRLATALTGRSVEAMDCCFCGNVLDCVNAALENGCGRTRFCPDCTIRAAITETYTTGRPVTDRPAILCRRNGKGEEHISLLVTTRKDGVTVLLRLRTIPAAGTARPGFVPAPSP